MRLLDWFILLQAVTTLLAWWKGGKPERWVGWLLAGAFLATSVAREVVADGFRSVDFLLFMIDLSLFAALIAVALRANRWWPMWIAALHLLAIAIHGVRGLDPTILPIVYARMTGYIGFPICLVLIIGTISHVVRKRLQGRTPADWSALRW